MAKKRTLVTASGRVFDVPPKWTTAMMDRVFGLDSDGWPIARHVEEALVLTMRPATAEELAQNEHPVRVAHDGEPTAEDLASGLTRHVANEKSVGFTMDFGLTLCCAASFKGLERGVGCRACYRYAHGNDEPFGEVEPIVRA